MTDAEAPAPTTPEAEKLPVEDYDFRFIGNEVLQITVWPTKGDKVYRTPEGFRFVFERLEQEQEVHRHNLLGVLITKSTRAPFTLEEFQRKMREAAEAKKKNVTSPA